VDLQELQEGAQNDSMVSHYGFWLRGFMPRGFLSSHKKCFAFLWFQKPKVFENFLLAQKVGPQDDCLVSQTLLFCKGYIFLWRILRIFGAIFIYLKYY
jgi:hypothetical protein